MYKFRLPVFLALAIVFSFHSSVSCQVIETSSTAQFSGLLSTVNLDSVIAHPAALHGDPTVKLEQVAISPGTRKFSFVSSKDINKRDKEIVFEELPQPLHQKDAAVGFLRDGDTVVLLDTDEVPCVLAQFTFKITFFYPIKSKEENMPEEYMSVVVKPPNNYEVSGKCDRDAMIAVLNLKWETYSLLFNFAYDEDLDSFYVKQFALTFDTSDKVFKDAKREEVITLTSIPDHRYWQTNQARSFRCTLLHDISLDNEEDPYEAWLHFDEVRVQATTDSYRFKTSKHCVHRAHRDPNVPIAVAGTLMMSTVITVVGYAIFRYLKVKKFQYGTMHGMEENTYE